MSGGSLVDRGRKTSGRILPQISGAAARCLHFARDLSDESGEVPGGQMALAKALDRDIRRVRHALAELEAAGLARRVGVMQVFVSGGRKTSAVDEQAPTLKQRWRSDRGRLRAEPDAMHPGEGKNPEFRYLRARMGGLERALAASQAKKEEAERLLAKLSARNVRSTPSVAAMRADLMHASDCLDTDCSQCLRIGEMLEDDDGPYATERELSERLERGSAAERAARAIVGALRNGNRSALVEAVRAADEVLGDV